MKTLGFGINISRPAMVFNIVGNDGCCIVEKGKLLSTIKFNITENNCLERKKTKTFERIDSID